MAMAMAMAVSSSSSWVQSCCCSFINSFSDSTSINAKAHFTNGTSLSLVTSSTLGGRYGLTRCRDWSGLKSRAKFEKFDGVAPLESHDELSTASLDRKTAVEDVEEDYSCLPFDLKGTVRQSGKAAYAFVS